ncbi:MAG TPA: three-Cys-motif partner protein TcmP [Polyangia bacterium]|nr:three-Cys-motif partner protein TcmP [Polyangia bacterium]
MDAPEEYRDREQTFFKHQVLSHYLRAWTQKLASVSRGGRTVRLWYVDCFAGPWQSQTDEQADTSVAIGLGALEEALERWKGSAGEVQAGAIFVEASGGSARRLRDFVRARPNRGVSPHVLEGEFADKVPEIQKIVGTDPAFVFVDPTGWKGAGMGHIAPLVAGRYRDVIVNVMFHHINRWKYDQREFLRGQMREFFGLIESDLPADLDERGLRALYRRQLADRTNVPHVADLAIPHPIKDQTFFRLVVGGHHPEVLRLFRDIEEKVVGREAGAVRARAKARASEERTGQLQFDIVPSMDVRYRKMRDADVRHAVDVLQRRLEADGPASFGNIWPVLLGDYHITRKHLADAVAELRRTGKLLVTGMVPGDRTIKDYHLVHLNRASTNP